MASTPSTRRQLDGVAVWSLTDRFGQHSRTRLTGLISTQVPAEPGDTLGSVGYRNGDQCAFTYLGPAEEDLRPEFRAAEDVSVSSSDEEDEA